MRDHEPKIINEFNGLWKRGDDDSVPLDHFQDGINFKFSSPSSVATRDGLGISQDVAVPLSNVKRFYNYPTNSGNTVIALTVDTSGNGKIYHIKNVTTVYLILTIAGMTDFAFVPYAGRAYISPFASFETTGLDGNILYQEKGLQNEFLYVYAGDGTTARKAAGSPMSGALTIANGAAGHTDAGVHVFAFVSETISGFLSAPGQNASFTTSPAFSVSFGGVQATGSPLITKRHLVATKKLASFNGDLTGQTFYFVPNATINNDTDTFLNNISFYDADLLDDASHLTDNYSQIPAGAVLGLYHDRLCLAATFTDISLILLSAPGEPEAIDQIEGLITVPLDGNPITNLQEMRDVMYVTKRSRTVSYTDNEDVPSSWLPSDVDNSLGTFVHGVATVLDRGGTNVDFLIIATYQGVSLFNGRYIAPELTLKIEDYWQKLNRKEFRKIQIIHAPIQKEILMVLPNRNILVGNYMNGMDAEKIRWTIWSYDMGVNTIAIVNIDQVIVGTDMG